MMGKTLLPPGFRFHPTDVELVQYYLKRKVTGKSFRFEAISEIELYKFAPWDLPDKSCLRSKDQEWYFFCPRDRKYPNGSKTKTNRATDIGYWKTTGKDRPVIHKSRTVGMKKTLIFHVGKAPRGDRTDWVMYEYRLEDNELLNAGYSLDAYVLCKIFQKSGPGPKIGEQYGAPFNEEDWEDDTIIDNAISFPCAPFPKPLDDQLVLLEPICQQSVFTGVCEVSSTSDLPDADGMLLDHLPEFLIGSPPQSENANNKGGINYNVNYSGTINNEYELQPVLTELGCEQYVELNDIYSLWEGDPSELVVPSDLFARYPLVQDPSSPNLNDMHVQTFSISVTTAMNDPLPVGTGMINDQSAVFLEMEDFGRSVPEMSAPVYEVDDDETILQELVAAIQMN
ncbi:NAC domain-containing protein 82-like isoform X2 [Phoenix dactylifera]|uniref:NAC domain-containing protein 82-like isoform X2 n=1 Tax=Phoenix dactylifera TaxID=42345 RepID=A0A8B9ASU2_PHODC|nr:NAC domain-containing protein 82-like isoform X2 [Phoenix dactylifera]